jgi:hypothetical protein
LPQVVLRQLDLRPDDDIATPPKLTDAVRVISRVLEGVEHAAELGDTEVFIPKTANVLMAISRQTRFMVIAVEVRGVWMRAI